MTGGRDIIVTWPKPRPLDSYLTELQRARTGGQVINFRVSNPPPRNAIAGDDRRLYRVHDGMVRGWTPIVDVLWRPPNRVLDPITGDFWPAGHYVVCRPSWHACSTPIEMPGFRGWRWFDRTSVGD